MRSSPSKRSKTMSFYYKNLDEVLKCHICTNTVTNPKTLVCNHSFCKSCLDTILRFNDDGSAEIKCPHGCSERTRITNKQTTNYLVADSMLEKLAHQRRIDHRATSATQPDKLICDSRVDCISDYSAYCITCDLFLCDKCRSRHITCQKLNPVVSVSYDYVEERIKVLCMRHESEAVYLCCNNEFICVYCSNRRHKGHAHTPVEHHQLFKEMKQISKFTKNVSRKMKETKEEIRFAKEQFKKLIAMKKLRCVAEYIEYLNEEERRVREEFRTLSANHVNEFQVTEPTECCNGKVPKEVRDIISKKVPVRNSVDEYVGKNKHIPKITVSMTSTSFLDQHPLGEVTGTFGKYVPIEEAKDTFSGAFRLRPNDRAPEKLLHDIQKLCQGAFNCKFREFEDSLRMDLSTTKKFYKIPDKSRSSPRPRKTSIYDVTDENDDDEEDKDKNQLDEPADVKTSPEKPTDSGKERITCSEDHLSQSPPPYDLELVSECVEKYEEKGMDYIEDLIKKRKNKVLNVLLHLRPDILNECCTVEPYYNRIIHLAAKYNNVNLMKEMVRIDKSVIDHKNGIGSTALHASASYTTAFDATCWLLENFPHLIYERNESGGTPLHAAACRNNLEAVVELLKYGADTTTCDAKGRRPVDLADLNDYLSVSDLLKEAGRAATEF